MVFFRSPLSLSLGSGQPGQRLWLIALAIDLATPLDPIPRLIVRVILQTRLLSNMDSPTPRLWLSSN